MGVGPKVLGSGGQVGRGGIVGVDVVLRGHPLQALLSQQFWQEHFREKSPWQLLAAVQ